MYWSISNCANNKANNWLGDFVTSQDLNHRHIATYVSFKLLKNHDNENCESNDKLCFPTINGDSPVDIFECHASICHASEYWKQKCHAGDSPVLHISSTTNQVLDNLNIVEIRIIFL